MAEKIYRADINLKNNEIKNFAVHNIDPETVVNPVDGQEVYFEGKLFVYDANITAWVEQGTASSIAQVASDLASEVTRATTAESTLQTNINNEATARENADVALGERIDAEEARALAAEADLQQQIAEKDSLPERNAGTAGKFLTNDGTDASWAALPEYTITKDAQAETGYAHTYHLTKDGVNVGASINIPKDMVVESGTVETCTQDDVPVVGYKVGDKYIDLVLANSSQSHLYILVSDLIDVYQGSTYIDITNNTISLKYSDLETKLQDTFYTESEINNIVDGLEASIATKVAQSDYNAKIAELEAADDALDSAKADKATTLAGYNISDAYTKTEIDNMLSAKKQVVSCPSLTASGSQFTWSFNNTVGEDAVVTIYESGVEVIADVSVTASTITIKMNETAELPSISAGQFKAVILG